MTRSVKNLVVRIFYIFPVVFLLLLTPTFVTLTLVNTEGDFDYTSSELSTSNPNNKNVVNNHRSVFLSDLPQIFIWTIFLVALALISFLNFELLITKFLYYFYTRAPPSFKSVFI